MDNEANQDSTCFHLRLVRDGAWWIAECVEVPGANGMGRTARECAEDTKKAIALILKDRRQSASNPAASPRQGCRLKSRSRSHLLIHNPQTEEVQAVPRHKTLPARLARKICRGLSVPEMG